MVDIKFNGCRLEMQLEAQSPMIHFQNRQPGATIRATEVKPKLDRFILRGLQKTTGKDIRELRGDSEYGGIFTDKDHEALNYRMQLDASGQPYSIVNVGDTRAHEYDIFYGNTAEMRRAHKELRGIFSNPKLTILCFNEKLRSLIEKYIGEFFLVTNFGTMQGKGFGSFAPAGLLPAGGQLDTGIQAEIARYLKAATGSARCYCMRFGAVPSGQQEKNDYCNRIFGEIKSFYSIMKSGQNFSGYSRAYIYQYMHVRGTDNRNNAGDVSIDNEKAWMKQNGISPALAKPENERRTDRKDENPRYVRALLGTAGAVTYQASFENRRDRTTVQITDMGTDKLERVASPIFFKIVGNVVFITAREVPDEIYDREFAFSNKENGRKATIKTPSRDDFKSGKFDIQSFLASYVDYYNVEARKKLKNISRNARVEEV